MEQLLDFDPAEKGYLKECFKFWNGFTGGIEPLIPEEIGRAKAQILKYKAKGIAEDEPKRRRMDRLVTKSFKASPDFFQKVSSDSSQVDVNVSVFIRACVQLASPVIKANPRLINFFSDSVIPR